MGMLLLQINNNRFYYYDYVNNEIIYTLTELLSKTEEQVDINTNLNSDSFILNLNNTRSQLTLCVSDKCNMRCKYCVYQDNRFQNVDFSYENMTFEIAKRAIDNFMVSSKYMDTVAITFYGGEPLMNYALIQECVNYIKEEYNDRSVYLSMTTNATLLTEEIIIFLIENNFVINISLDGNKRNHDSNRVLADKSPTFDKIMDKIKIICSLDRDFFINNIHFSTVLDNDILDYDTYEFIELTPHSMRVAEVEEGEYYKNLKKENEITKNETLKLNNINPLLYPKTFSYSLDKEQKVIDILRQGKSYQKFTPGGFCLPMVKNAYVDIHGNYYICEKVCPSNDNEIGNVFDGINIEKIYNLNKKIENIMRTKCSKCFASRFCEICYAVTDKEDYHLELFCNQTKDTVKVILIKYLNKNVNKIFEGDYLC